MAEEEENVYQMFHMWREHIDWCWCEVNHIGTTFPATRFFVCFGVTKKQTKRHQTQRLLSSINLVRRCTNGCSRLSAKTGIYWSTINLPVEAKNVVALAWFEGYCWVQITHESKHCNESHKPRECPLWSDSCGPSHVKEQKYRLVRNICLHFEMLFPIDTADKMP